MVKTSVKTTSAIFAGTVLLFGVLFLLFRHREQTISQPRVTIGKTTIDVSIADTPTEQEQGLSGTPSLPANEGKLFIFQAPGNYGFWMKDMYYPLDIIWIDSTNTVVGISKDVLPDSYPEVVYPPSLVQSVLEVNAGFSTHYGVSIGDHVVLQK